MKPTLLSKLDSWLLNVVYFSQFGCCNPETCYFSQDTNCATFRRKALLIKN